MFRIIFLIFLYSNFIYSQDKSINELSNQKKVLEVMKQQIVYEEKELKKIQKKKENVLTEFKQIENNISSINYYLKQFDSIQNKINLSISRKNKTLAIIKNKIKTKEEWISKRIRKLYLNNYKNTLFFNLKEESNWLKKLFFVQRVVEHDRNIIQEINKDRENYYKNLKKLQEKYKENTIFQKEKNKEFTIYKKKKKQLSQNIKNISQNENKKKKLIEEKKENAKKIEKIILKLEKSRLNIKEKQNTIPPKQNETLKYCHPLIGSKLISKYGIQFHKTLKTKTQNLGIELEGKSSQPVKSITYGNVVYKDDIPGHGNGIIIYTRRKNYLIYGNLQNIQVEVGDDISPCQTIATISSSKNRRNRTLYFEMRDNRTSINPISWFKRNLNV